MHPLHAFFEPRNVALIGASSDPDKLGGRPIRFLKTAGYAGAILPVNPKTGGEIQGLRAYRSVDEIAADLGEPVEHAVIVVPAPGVEQALHDCGRAGIRAVQVFSSGFGELGAEGLRQQERLVEVARSYGMRMLGPNCLGIVSVANGFHATFSTALEALVPTPGVIGMATQSGAFGSCAYATAIQRGIGLSRIVATGNEADIDVAECIEFLAADPATKVICAAIEGCRDGDKLRAAMRAAAMAGKPLVVMKVGSTEIGAAAAATHTGSLAGNDAVFDAVFAECGAWRAQSIEEMLDVAALCATGPLPANHRAAIVTLSGGIGVLMADACEGLGLQLPPLPAAVADEVTRIAPFVAEFSALGNPLDTTAQIASVKEGQSRIVSALLDGTDWGTVFVYIAQKAAAAHRFGETLQVLQQIRRDHPQRCLVLVGPSDEGVRRQLEAAGIVMMTDPSRAVAAAAAAAWLRTRRTQIEPDVPVAEATRHPLGDVANEAGAKALLARYGLPMLPERLCADADAAVRAARDLGLPVVLKIASPDIAHKTEVGGIALNLADESALRAAFDAMLVRVRAAAPQARLDGVLVAPMASGGVETILGVHIDAVFGPMMMFGLGGIAVELFKDVRFASAPLSRERARRLVRSVKSAPLFDGWRGGPAMDVEALVEALVALSRFAAEHAGAIAGAEVNPFLVRPSGGYCLDALIQPRAER